MLDRPQCLLSLKVVRINFPKRKINQLECVFLEKVLHLSNREKKAQKKIFLGRVLGVADSGCMRQHH